MRVKEITIEGFGKLVNKSFSFCDSFNIITGLNEAGKTTVIDAVLGVLFGFKGRSEDVKSLKDKYRPWDASAPYRARIIVNFDDNFDYCIERDFDENWVNICKVEKDESTPLPINVQELLGQKLGLSTGRLFQSTLLIKQQEVADLHRLEVSDAILRKLTESGTGASVKEILRILSERAKELQRGVGRVVTNPGPIKIGLDEIERMRGEIKDVSQRYIEYNEILTELKRRKQEKQEIIHRIEKISPIIDNFERQQKCYDKLVELNKRIAELALVKEKLTYKEAELESLREKLSVYKNAEKTLNIETLQKLEFTERKLNIVEQKIEQLDGEFLKIKTKRNAVLREMGNYNETIASFYSVRYNEKSLVEAKRLQEGIHSLKEVLYEKENILNKMNSNMGFKVSMSFWIGLALCLISALGIFTDEIIGYVMASLLFVTGIITMYFGGVNSQYRVSRELAKITEGEIGRLKNNLNTYKRMLEGILAEDNMESFEQRVKEQVRLKQKIKFLDEERKNLDLTSLEQVIEGAKEEHSQYLEQANSILMQANVATIEEYRERFENYKDTKARLNNVQEALEFLKEESRAKNADEEMVRLRDEISSINQYLENIEKVPEEQYVLLKEELEIIKGVLEKTREEEIKTAASVENYNRLILQDRDLWSMEMALVEKETAHKQLELESKGIELALKLIQEATEEVRSQMSPQVKNKIVKIFQWITKKRYRDVRLEMEGDNLVFQVKDEDYSSFREIHYLSTGTRDQLYLALRIALGEYLTRCNSFPIFLDDPFVNFDYERLLKTLEILRLLSREHQIIWLTKDTQMGNYISEAKVMEL